MSIESKKRLWVLPFNRLDEMLKCDHRYRTSELYVHVHVLLAILEYAVHARSNY